MLQSRSQSGLAIFHLLPLMGEVPFGRFSKPDGKGSFDNAQATNAMFFTRASPLYFFLKLI